MQNLCLALRLVTASKTLDGNYLSSSILHMLQHGGKKRRKKQQKKEDSLTGKKPYIINEGSEGFWKGCFAIFLSKNPIRGFQQPRNYQVLSIRFHEHMIPHYGILKMLIIQCVCT